MWAMAWMFWMVPLFIFFAIMRRRRWERWAMRQGGYPVGRPDGDTRRQLDTHQSSLEELEGRVAQLEEKLDFTERLVSGRREG